MKNMFKIGLYLAMFLLIIGVASASEFNVLGNFTSLSNPYSTDTIVQLEVKEDGSVAYITSEEDYTLTLLNTTNKNSISGITNYTDIITTGGIQDPRGLAYINGSLFLKSQNDYYLNKFNVSNNLVTLLYSVLNTTYYGDGNTRPNYFFRGDYYVYVMHFFDQIVVVNKTDASFITNSSIDTGNSPELVVYDNDTIFVKDGIYNRIYSVNVTDLFNIKVLNTYTDSSGSCSISGDGRGIALKNNVLYVSSSSTDVLTLLNVTNKNSITCIGSLSNTASGSRAMRIIDDYLFSINTTSVSVWLISSNGLTLSLINSTSRINSASNFNSLVVQKDSTTGIYYLYSTTNTSTFIIYEFNPQIPPSNPVITYPNATNYLQNTKYMNITYLNSSVTQLPISYYSINLLNDDYSNNMSITTNNSLNNNYVWDIYSSNISIGNYYVEVCAYDTANISNCSTQLFYLDTNMLLNVNLTDITSTYVQNFNLTLKEGIISTQTKGTTNYTISFDVKRGVNYELILDMPQYAYLNQTITTNNTNEQNLTLQGLNADTISINVYDEVTQTLINETINLVIQSETFLQNYTTSNGTKIITNLSNGDYVLSASNSNYSSRTYSFTITTRSSQIINLRLAKNNETSSISIYTKSEQQRILPGALITIQRQYYGGSYATILQTITDESGLSIINVVEGENYKIILSATGYTTKEFFKEFYVVNSPYTFLVSATSGSPYINVLNGVNYYYTPTSTELVQNATQIFSISTYNSSFTIQSTSIKCNATSITVVGSPGGSTASCTINLANYTGPYNVVYSFLYLDPKTLEYTNYTIPVVYYVRGAYPVGTIPIEQVFDDAKTDIGNEGWLGILSVLIIFGAVATIKQISGSTLAALSVGFVTLIALSFIGWVSPLLTVFVVLVNALLLYMNKNTY